LSSTTRRMTWRSPKKRMKRKWQRYTCYIYNVVPVIWMFSLSVAVKCLMFAWLCNIINSMYFLLLLLLLLLLPNRG
jgi:hypothetical protein